MNLGVCICACRDSGKTEGRGNVLGKESKTHYLLSICIYRLCKRKLIYLSNLSNKLMLNSTAETSGIETSDLGITVYVQSSVGLLRQLV